MSFRDKLKEIPVRDLPETPAIPWYTGDDVPFTFKRKELRRIAKKIIRQNYKKGFFNREEYIAALRHNAVKYKKKKH